MAIAFIRTQPLSRKTGRSAVAAASYRSGSCLTDERIGQVFDYTRRGGVEHTELLMPERAGAAAAWDREQLWNAAEAAEKRKDARVAREWIGALPVELTREQRIELSREFAKELTAAYGVAVDFALHEPGRHGDDRNYHVHYLATTRAVMDGELREKAALEKGLDTSHVVQLREVWEKTVNRALEHAARDERIDMRPFAGQRDSAIMAGDVIRAAALDRLPTQHVGWQAMAMERRGHESERGNQHRAICEQNGSRREQAIERAQLEVAVRRVQIAAPQNAPDDREGKSRPERIDAPLGPSMASQRSLLESGGQSPRAYEQIPQAQQRPEPQSAVQVSAREAYCRPQQQEVIRSQVFAVAALRELRLYEMAHPHRVKLADEGFLGIKLLRWEDKQLTELRSTFAQRLRESKTAGNDLRQAEAEYDRKAGGRQEMEPGQRSDTERLQQMGSQLLQEIDSKPHRTATLGEVQESHRQFLIQNQILESQRQHALNYEDRNASPDEPQPRKTEEAELQGPTALQAFKDSLSPEQQSRVERFAATELSQGTEPDRVREAIEKWMLPATPAAAEYASEVVSKLDKAVERTAPQYEHGAER